MPDEEEETQSCNSNTSVGELACQTTHNIHNWLDILCCKFCIRKNGIHHNGVSASNLSPSQLELQQRRSNYVYYQWILRTILFTCMFFSFCCLEYYMREMGYKKEISSLTKFTLNTTNNNENATSVADPFESLLFFRGCLIEYLHEITMVALTSCVWILIFFYMAIFQGSQFLLKYGSSFFKKKSNRRFNSMSVPHETQQEEESSMTNDIQGQADGGHNHDLNQNFSLKGQESFHRQQQEYFTRVSSPPAAVFGSKQILFVPELEWYSYEIQYGKLLNRGHVNGHNFSQHAIFYPRSSSTQGNINQTTEIENSSMPVVYEKNFRVDNTPIIQGNPWNLMYWIYGWGVSLFALSLNVHGLCTSSMFCWLFVWSLIPSFMYDGKIIEWETHFFAFYLFIPMHKLGKLCLIISILVSFFWIEYKKGTISWDIDQLKNDEMGLKHYDSDTYYLLSHGAIFFYLTFASLIFFKCTQDGSKIGFTASDIMHWSVPSVSFVSCTFITILMLFLEVIGKLTTIISVLEHNYYPGSNITKMMMNQQQEEGEGNPDESSSKHIRLFFINKSYFLFSLFFMCPLSLYFSLYAIIQSCLKTSQINTGCLISCILFSYILNSNLTSLISNHQSVLGLDYVIVSISLVTFLLNMYNENLIASNNHVFFRIAQE